MNLRATTEFRFLIKYLLIGIACLAFSAWSFYDAIIGYPSKLPRAEAWQVLLDDESLDDGERDQRWQEIAEEKGWSTDRPKKKEQVNEVQSAVAFNYGTGILSLLIGAPCLFWFVKNQGTWIEARDQEIANSAGVSFRPDQVLEIDKKKWEKKGIAVVRFKDDSGQESKFVIDDLKYQREPTDKIIDWLESQVDRKLIVNGITEAELRDSWEDEEEEEEDTE